MYRYSKSNSTTTRIETPFHLTRASPGTFILNQIPLQQGLKRPITALIIESYSNSKSNSTTTRIETKFVKAST